MEDKPVLGKCSEQKTRPTVTPLTNTRKPHSRANACGTAVKKTGSHNVEKQLPKDRHRHTGERNGAAVGGRQGGGEN